MEDMNITFEDLPKAMSWMMDKLNKLDSKIDSLNNIPQVRPVDQWMNLKELCEYLPSQPIYAMHSEWNLKGSLKARFLWMLFLPKFKI